MLRSVRRTMVFLREKQILHKLGVLLSLTIIGVACYVLYHMLRDLDFDEVVDAIRDTEPRQIMLAGLFVAGGICGGLLGTRLARLLADRRGALNTLFAAVIVAVALYMLLRSLNLL